VSLKSNHHEGTVHAKEPRFAEIRRDRLGFVVRAQVVGRELFVLAQGRFQQRQTLRLPCRHTQKRQCRNRMLRRFECTGVNFGLGMLGQLRRRFVGHG